MALVNTGAELARRGRKVLLVDFDLEAPGLSTYNLLRPAKPCPGIVEYVTEFRQTRRSPSVKDFIYEAGKVGKKGGQIWVMPAGRGDAEYRRMLNGLNWKALYQDEDGFLLFEDTREQWEAEFHPDYVLIDARTGHTDIEGICTRQLANAVVVIFYPNEQNLAGLTEVCRHIRAEATGGLEKKIKLHFVVSNVPDLDDEDQHLHSHLEKFHGQLSIPNSAPMTIIHRNETLQMLAQPIFVLERPHSRLAREYRRLVRTLQIENREDRDGALLFLREIQKRQSKLVNWTEHGAPGWYVEPTRVAVDQITERFWNDAELLFRAGELLLQCREPDKALVRLNRALALHPHHADALFERAFCYREICQDAAAAEDLLQYLREQPSQVSADEEHGRESGVSSNELANRRKSETNNELALLELTLVSMDIFFEALELPPVPIPADHSFSRGRKSNDAFWLLGTITFRLIQQRRWDDAIRCLEHPKVKAAIEMETHIYAKVRYLFLLAIAYWGKTGEPCRESCLQALVAYGEVRLQTLLAYKPELDDYEDVDPEDFPFPAEDVSALLDVALLCWGAGQKEAAKAALNGAFACLDYIDDLGESLTFSISDWTFQETTRHQFRQDCIETSRMIQGEPVRPAFLGLQR